MTDLLAANAVSAEGWLTFVGGLFIGLLSVAAAVAIAWWQRAIGLRDREADRAERATRERTARDQADRIDRRSQWEPEYHETRDLLKRAQEVAYQVRFNGPLDDGGFNAVDLDRLAMEAEQLAARGIDALRDSLLRIAELARELRTTAAPPEAVILAAYAGRPIPTALSLREIQRGAVNQDRIGTDLTDILDATWKALRHEWGL